MEGRCAAGVSRVGKERCYFGAKASGLVASTLLQLLVSSKNKGHAIVVLHRVASEQRYSRGLISDSLYYGSAVR
jgi:hypothetical protein